MRDCCKEYVDILKLLARIRYAVPESRRADVDAVIAFVKAEYEAHVDRAGESAWRG